MADFLKLSQTKSLENIKKAANELKTAQNSAANSASSSTSIFSMGDNSVNVSDLKDNNFIEALSGKKAEELSDLEKAQYELISAMADTDGDGKISKTEIQGLDSDKTGKINQTDIDAMFAELGIGTDSSIDDLLDAVDSILTSEENPVEEATIASKSGAAYNKEDGTYSLKVEDYRDGKVQDDGEGGKRYPNGSYWGMVTNAYPNVSEADKEKVYEMIGEMNGFDWKTHTLYTGDEIKLPILEYDKDGNVTGYHKSEKVEDKQQGTKPATTNTGSTTASSSTGVQRGSTSATSATNVKSSSTSANSSTTIYSTTKSSTTEKANTDYSELNKFVQQCKDGGFVSVDSLEKLLSKVETGNYNIKDFIAEYDKNNSPKFMETFDVKELYTTEEGQEVANKFADLFIEAYGGADSTELAKYVDKACENKDMGGFYLAGAPTLMQSIYQNASDEILAKAVKDPTNQTSLSSFYQNGVYDNTYESGLQGLHKAEADYQENVKIMNEFQELYQKYQNDSVTKNQVEYDNYGCTDGKWDPFHKNYEGKNSIADIYEKFTKDGMGNGSINYSKYHISMYKEALEKLREYDKLMG